MTRADIDAVYAMIDGIQQTPDPDGKLTSMIMEEAQIYFTGAKSLDETVKVIEDRISLYISENS